MCLVKYFRISKLRGRILNKEKKMKRELTTATYNCKYSDRRCSHIEKQTQIVKESSSYSKPW